MILEKNCAIFIWIYGFYNYPNDLKVIKKYHILIQYIHRLINAIKLYNSTLWYYEYKKPFRLIIPTDQIGRITGTDPTCKQILSNN
jgi:hypothetical protein